MNLFIVRFSLFIIAAIAGISHCCAQSVGIGSSSFTPGSMLAVDGGVSIGNTYRSTAAPANGLIIEGNVGIGTSSPSDKLHIVDAANGGFRFDEYGAAGAVMRLRAAGGTITVPTAVTAGSVIGSIVAQGYTGSAFTAAIGSISFIAEDVVATGDAPTYITFSTSNDGAASATEKMRITSAGNVGIGTTSVTSKLSVNGQIDVNSNKIINVATCTAGTDAANKDYVDGAVADGLRSAFQTKASVTNATSTYVTVLNATTPGILYGIRFKTTSASAGAVTVKITIDGNVLTEQSFGGRSIGVWYYPDDTEYFLWETPMDWASLDVSASPAPSDTRTLMHIEFKTLKYEIKGNIGTTTGEVLYGLD